MHNLCSVHVYISCMFTERAIPFMVPKISAFAAQKRTRTVHLAVILNVCSECNGRVKTWSLYITPSLRHNYDSLTTLQFPFLNLLDPYKLLSRQKIANMTSLVTKAIKTTSSSLELWLKKWEMPFTSVFINGKQIIDILVRKYPG